MTKADIDGYLPLAFSSSCLDILVATRLRTTVVKLKLIMMK